MVRLVPADVGLLEAAVVGDEALARAVRVPVVPGWITFAEALGPTLDAAIATGGDTRWGTRFFLSVDPPELVGWGGFKGPPQDGVVEIGYEIAEVRQGQGLATAAAEAMVGEAFADEAVSAVIAHTLPERNASTRVLEKSGFDLDGEAAEDGETVWRWRLARVDARTDRP